MSATQRQFDFSENQASALASLPTGWSWVHAADVCDGIDSGATPKKEYFVEEGEGVPFIKVYNLTFGGPLDFTNKPTFVDPNYHSDKMRRSTTRPGAVLMNIVGPPLGKVSLVTDEYPEWNINQAVAVFRPAAYSNRLLSYYLSSAGCQSWLRSTAKTTTSQVNLSVSTCRRLPLPLPPLREQEEIADAVDSHLTKIDAAIAGLKRVQANLKRYRASVLKAAVEGRLVPTEAELAREEGRDYEPASVLLGRILAERRRRWEEAELAKMKAKGKTPKNDTWKAKYKEPAPPDTDGLPELPEGWCWASVGQITVSLDQGWSPKCSKKASADEKQWAVMKTSAVQPMSFVDVHNKALPDELVAREHLEIVENDLLVTRAGPRSRVGICCLVRSTRRRIMLCDKVYRLRTAQDFFSAGYLEILINEPRIMSEIEERKSGISDSGLNLTQDRFLELVIPVPPLSEQLRVEDAIGEHLAVVRRTAADCEASIQRSVRLRQSILKWAFEGKLVDQDPNDEPASVLLDRIRAEREAAAQKPKKAKATKKKTTKKKAARKRSAKKASP